MCVVVLLLLLFVCLRYFLLVTVARLLFPVFSVSVSVFLLYCFLFLFFFCCFLFFIVTCFSFHLSKFCFSCSFFFLVFRLSLRFFSFMHQLSYFRCFLVFLAISYSPLFSNIFLLSFVPFHVSLHNVAWFSFTFPFLHSLFYVSFHGSFFSCNISFLPPYSLSPSRVHLTHHLSAFLSLPLLSLFSFLYVMSTLLSASSPVVAEGD